jgi:hypothetical protein
MALLCLESLNIALRGAQEHIQKLALGIRNVPSVPEFPPEFPSPGSPEFPYQGRGLKHFWTIKVPIFRPICCPTTIEFR